MWEAKNLRVVVCGAGLTGQAICRALRRRGAEVIATDSRPAESLPGAAQALAQLGVELRAGGHDPEVLAWAELVVLSPGVPPKLPVFDLVRRKGVLLWSELELAFHLTSTRLIAITGTKGKTTTAVLVGRMLEAPVANAAAYGPVGTPLTALIDEAEADTLVVEVTSYQLEGVQEFHPAVAALLNVTQDHTARHSTREEYLAVKARIFARQTPDEVAVFLADDPEVRQIGETCSARKIPFSLRQPLRGGVWAGEDGIWEATHGRERQVVAWSELTPALRRQRPTAIAAVAVGLAAGLPVEVIQRELRAFPGLPHRLEHLGEWRGIGFINDSAATNPAATQHALENVAAPVVLIAGGDAKGNDLSVLREAFRRLRGLVTIGQSGPELAALGKAAGVSRIAEVESLEAAVEQAVTWAQPGDTVLLSPACASYDMFADFAQRGEVFRRAIAKLRGTDHV
ncbi:MAG TPA: UDP-N-acetylmuramoyl-L-alanine--D-glutamate ligase [Armatimonadetes bacterium]|nr:UDP-N-acetylmuramoyl-L-alanine--D-glutamate ligase [Armatimonadota bacterium]